MTSLFRAAQNPGQQPQQFLTPVQAELLTARLTRQAEDAIASDMAQDYQARHNDPDHATEAAPAITAPMSFSPRHPNRGRYYRIVQRNNNRSFHAGVRGRLSQKSVARLLALYHYRCLKCGSQTGITLDHIKPLVKGGRGDITNIQPLCSRCNNTKAEQVADYRPRPTLLAVYTIYALYRVERFTHSLRQHCHRVLYRFDQRYTSRATSPGYHFDTDPPGPTAPATTTTTSPAISQ